MAAPASARRVLGRTRGPSGDRGGCGRPMARAHPAVPRAWAPRAGPRYTTSRSSWWPENSNLQRRLAPPPTRSRPSAFPAPRLRTATLLRGSGDALTPGQLPPRPLSTATLVGNAENAHSRHLAHSRNTFNYLRNTPKPERSGSHLPVPHGPGIPLAPPEQPLPCPLRGRGSAFW